MVNNAGVMIFGEFEWFTERQILQQIDVNVLGTFRVAKAFLPLLRQHKGKSEFAVRNFSRNFSDFLRFTIRIFPARKNFPL